MKVSANHAPLGGAVMCRELGHQLARLAHVELRFSSGIDLVRCGSRVRVVFLHERALPRYRRLAERGTELGLDSRLLAWNARVLDLELGPSGRCWSSIEVVFTHRLLPSRPDEVDAYRIATIPRIATSLVSKSPTVVA